MTSFRAIRHVLEYFRPQEGWIVKRAAGSGEVTVDHPNLGTTQCFAVNTSRGVQVVTVGKTPGKFTPVVRPVREKESSEL